MVELNYIKLQEYLHKLVDVKGEKAAHITKNSGVWNVKKMMAGENEPTLNSWVRLHEAYPDDIPAPEYVDGDKVYKYVTASGQSRAAGENMTITNNHAPGLSPEEQTFINLLREKDPTHIYLRRCIAELIMREDPD